MRRMGRRSARVSAMDPLKSSRRVAPVNVQSGRPGPRGVVAVSRVGRELRHVTDNARGMESVLEKTWRSSSVKIERVPRGLSGETGLSAVPPVAREPGTGSGRVVQGPGIWRTRVLVMIRSLTRVMQARVMDGVSGNHGPRVRSPVELAEETDRGHVEL